MQTLSTIWQQLDTTTQTVFLAAFWGALLAVLQKVWTRIPKLPALQVDTAAWVKRLVAVSAVAITAWIQSGGNVQQFVTLLVPMLTASQTLHLWTQAKTPCATPTNHSPAPAA
jgi:hypothetical protein